MSVIERKETIFTEADLARSLVAAYDRVFRAVPTHQTLADAWSQIALECGRDGKGNIIKCRCFNLGNITVSQKQIDAGRDYWKLRCQEQLRDANGKLNGQWKWFDMRFAANESLDAGAEHYFRFFAEPKRKQALEGMRLGIDAFVAGLTAIWYMTANPDHYKAGLRGVQTRAWDLAREAIRNYHLSGADVALGEDEHDGTHQIPLVDEETREQTLNLVGRTLQDSNEEYLQMLRTMGVRDE